jgi:hypothetical protein
MGGSTFEAIGTVSSFAQATTLASSTGESAHFTMFVYRVNDPVDTGIISNLLMGRINENDFIVFHGSILTNPIGIQNSHIGVLAANFFFCNGLQVALKLELIDTLMFGLSKDHTTVNLTLASSTANATANDSVSLFGLVSQAMGFVGTRRTVEGQNVGTLTVFPTADTPQESQGIRLLATPDLFHVLVGTHLDLAIWLNYSTKLVRQSKNKRQAQLASNNNSNPKQTILKCSCNSRQMMDGVDPLIQLFVPHTNKAAMV